MKVQKFGRRLYMNKTVVLISVIMLMFVGALDTSHASKKPDVDVVINEVFPDEMDCEWIEIYNPTSKVVDLSYWKIMVNGAKGHHGKFIIPHGTIINSGAFIVFETEDFGWGFVSHKHGTVRLYGANGLVDKTYYDKIKCDWSWARVTDGYDTNSESDWSIEANPTKGTSNTGD